MHRSPTSERYTLRRKAAVYRKYLSVESSILHGTATKRMGATRRVGQSTKNGLVKKSKKCENQT